MNPGVGALALAKAAYGVQVLVPVMHVSQNKVAGQKLNKIMAALYLKACWEGLTLQSLGQGYGALNFLKPKT